MNETKVIQLKADAAAQQTKANCYKNDISAFKAKFNLNAQELRNKLDALRESLAVFATLVPPLSKEHSEQLHGIQRNLDQNQKALQKEYQKPLLQYQKDLAKCKNKVSSLLLQINAETEISKVKEIKAVLAASLACFERCDQELAECVIWNNDLNDQIAKVETEIRRIDLPHELSLTSKQVERVTESLTQLQLQMQQAPQKCSEYSKDFMFLRKTLSTFEERSQGFKIETDKLLEKQSTFVTPPAPTV